jgi:hypothetical protein
MLYKLEMVASDGRIVFCQDRRLRLKSVVFHIINFPNFFARHKPGVIDKVKNKAILHHRILMQDQKWKIEVQALPQTDMLVRQLEMEGGYAITHVGRIKHVNDRAFTVSSLERLLRELHLLLSFGRGLYAAPFGVVGFNSEGQEVYLDWCMRQVAAWEPHYSWLSVHHGDCLAELFPGFRSLLSDPCFGKSVENALYWYLRSNRAGEGPGIDGGIILAQAAIENLTYTYLDSKGLSKDNSASDRMGRVFKHFKLPTAIPVETKNLVSAKRKKMWSNAPEAIARMRNDLVHPKKQIKIGKYAFEAWNLSLWYIEIFILKLAGYSGVYFNRWRCRWRGQVESVPWVKKKA